MSVDIAGRRRLGNAKHRRSFLHWLLLLPLVRSADVLAQTFPSRPVKFIVPMAPGGGADIATRALSAKLQDLWGITVIVDNRSGGTGAIGLEAAKNARPDGLTIVLCTGSHAVLQAMQKRPYDLLNDFSHVTQITTAPYILVVNPSVKATSVPELIRYAKERPNGLTYSSAGLGSLQHLAGAMLATVSGAPLLHVPYRGGGPALADVLAGQIDMVFATPLESTPHIKTGRLRALATTGVHRMKTMPDLPTVAEMGLPGYEVTQWYGVLAPLGTPPEIIAKLNKDIAATIQAPEVAEYLAKEGVDVVVSTPEAFRVYVAAEIQRYLHAIKAAHLKVD